MLVSKIFYFKIVLAINIGFFKVIISFFEVL